MSNFLTIGQTVADIWRFFQDGGHRPYWIYDARVRTTQEGHLVVIIIVQNLAGIDTVVPMICKF